MSTTASNRREIEMPTLSLSYEVDGDLPLAIRTAWKFDTDLSYAIERLDAAASRVASQMVQVSESCRAMLVNEPTSIGRYNEVGTDFNTALVTVTTLRNQAPAIRALALAAGAVEAGAESTRP